MEWRRDLTSLVCLLLFEEKILRRPPKNKWACDLIIVFSVTSKPAIATRPDSSTVENVITSMTEKARTNTLSHQHFGMTMKGVIRS